MSFLNLFKSSSQKQQQANAAAAAAQKNQPAANIKPSPSKNSQQQQQQAQSNPWAPENDNPKPVYPNPKIQQFSQEPQAQQVTPAPEQKSGGLFASKGLKKKVAVNKQEPAQETVPVPPSYNTTDESFKQPSENVSNASNYGSQSEIGTSSNEVVYSQPQQQPAKPLTNFGRFKKTAPSPASTQESVQQQNSEPSWNASVPPSESLNSDANEETYQQPVSKPVVEEENPNLSFVERMRLKKLKKQQLEQQQQRSQQSENDEEIARKQEANRAMFNKLRFPTDQEQQEHASRGENSSEYPQSYSQNYNDASESSENVEQPPSDTWNALVEQEPDSVVVVEQQQPPAQKTGFKFLKKKQQQQEPVIPSEQSSEPYVVPVPVAAAATKKRSALEQIAIEKKNLKSELTRIVMQQHALIEQQNNLKRQILSLKDQRRQTIHEQNEFAERDCFEEAQNLEEHIQYLTDQVSAAEQAIMQSESDYNKFDSEKEQLYAQEIRMSEGWLGALSENKKEKIKEKEIFETNQSQKLKNEKYEIEEATEQLRISQDHLSLDRRHLEEETQQLTQNLNSQTSELTIDQSRLSISKKTLAKEIKDLREQLQRKEEEFDEVSENLDAVTVKIKAIQSKFDLQLKRIDAKTAKLNEDERAFQGEKEILDRLIEQNLLSKEEMETQMANFEQELTNLQNTRNQLSEIILAIKQAKEQRESALVRYRDTYAVYVDYKRTLVEDEEKLGQLVEEQKLREEQINELKSRVAGISDKLPILENEKKSLVQQKKFKNAGTVAADIKELTTQMEEAIKSIEELKQQELAHENTVSQIQERKAESDKQLKELQRLADADKYKLLLVKLEDLKSLLEFASENQQEAIILNAEVEQTKREIEQIAENLPSSEQNEEAADTSLKNLSENNDQQVVQEQDGSIGLIAGAASSSAADNGEGEEQDEDSENSQQQTQADMDSMLKALIAKIKKYQQQFFACENEILHLAEAEDFEKAEEMQQTADDLKVKIDNLIEKLQSNYSCANLDEAEAYLQKFEVIQATTEEDDSTTANQQQQQQAEVTNSEENQLNAGAEVDRQDEQECEGENE